MNKVLDRWSYRFRCDIYLELRIRKEEKERKKAFPSFGGRHGSSAVGDASYLQAIAPKYVTTRIFQSVTVI